MSFAAPSDLLLRIDARFLGDLASDTDDPVLQKDFGTDTVLLAVLEDASGEVESAMAVNDLYSDTDLSGLAGNSLAKLKRMTCEIAISFLMQRRPDYNPERAKAFHDRAHEALEILRKGTNIFNLGNVREAGKPSIEAPTVRQIQDLNLITDRARAAYPSRIFPR